MKVDLHCHTAWSVDCNTPVETVLETYRNRGIDCAAITDHNEIEGALEAERLGIIQIIVGEEIMTTHGEVIGLFLTERIAPRMAPLETIEAIRTQGGVAMAPHPTDRLRGSALRSNVLAEVAKHLDLVEIFNGRTILASDDASARRYQEANGLVACVGSDAHTQIELGGCWNEIEGFDGPRDFIEKMRAARLHTEKSPKRVHFYSTLARVRSRLNRRK